jgi:CheY-like chemotaxis protein
LRDKLEILVVDDHVIVREGLKRILHECDDCVVAAGSGNL